MNYAAKSGSHAENRAPMSSLRGWRTTLVRRGREKVVGETGFAPAWALAREFLRLVCIHSTTRRKNWCGRGELHAQAPEGAAVFKTARSPVPRTAARIGRGGRSCTGTGNHAQRVLRPPCFLISPRRDKLVRTEGVAPSRACAHRILAPARILFRHIRKNWSIHRDVRPAVCLTKTVRRFLRVGCKVVEAEGLAPS